MDYGIFNVRTDVNACDCGEKVELLQLLMLLLVGLPLQHEVVLDKRWELQLLLLLLYYFWTKWAPEKMG